MQRALDEARTAAKYDIEVLILGESGTGKTLLALAMHNASPRREGPFVELDVARVPDTLIESELFGHEKGAFTGAMADRHGVFETAHCGTLFLDEIGNMSPAMQAKLLTVVETRRFSPVGGRTERTVDARFIAATNADLEREMKSDAFRSDLYYRLAKIPIWLPPLRERRSDILPFARRFLEEANVKLGRNVEGFSDECEARMLSYSWPANLRGLYSRIVWAVALTTSPRIGLGDLFRDLARHPLLPVEAVESNGDPSVDPALLTLAEVERRHIELVLRAQEGNITSAARVLGITRQGLHKKLKRHGLA